MTASTEIICYVQPVAAVAKEAGTVVSQFEIYPSKSPIDPCLTRRRHHVDNNL